MVGNNTCRCKVRVETTFGKLKPLLLGIETLIDTFVALKTTFYGDSISGQFYPIVVFHNYPSGEKE